MLIGFRKHIALLAVGATALSLTLALSAGALASSLFQSSLPPATTPFPTVFAPTPQTPADALPTATQPAVPAATPEPVVQPVLPTPTLSGFLPAPTLTNPNALPAVQPRADAAAAPALADPVETTVEAGQPTGGSGAAVLIDRVVATFSYVWLCCGGLLLVAAAVAFVLLSRHAAQR